MIPAIAVDNLTKRYGKFTALENVNLTLNEHRIYGLLGRNGAGKTTLMRILTGQEFATSGSVAVFGKAPYENEAVLSRVCFIKESQVYPQHLRVRHALGAAALVYPNWDERFARSLLEDFQLPADRLVKKLSRGMLSALGIIIGLAARTPLTFFDEPYLGLDAVARQLFYDRLLTDFSEHPRTVVLSTHLIDEVSALIEHVLLIDRGRIVLDDEVEAVRGQLLTVSGASRAVDEFAAAGTELHRTTLNGTARVTLRGAFVPADHDRARSLGLRVEAESLQELVVRLTASPRRPADAETAGDSPEKEILR